MIKKYKITTIPTDKTKLLYTIRQLLISNHIIHESTPSTKIIQHLNDNKCKEEEMETNVNIIMNAVSKYI